MIFLTLLQQNAAHVLEVLMVLLYSLKSAEQISLYNDEEATKPKIQASWKGSFSGASAPMMQQRFD